jgi:4-hydroxybenzoyl-CoA thioesterase
VARVEIDLPERFAFATEIPVRIDDVNYGGHLANDAVLSLAHEARVRFLASRGLSELDAGDGVGIIMSDAAIVYRAEGRHGMVLRAELAFADVRSRGLDVLYRFTDVASGAEIARARTGLLCYDYRAARIARMPERLRAALAAG